MAKAQGKEALAAEKARIAQEKAEAAEAKKLEKVRQQEAKKVEKVRIAAEKKAQKICHILNNEILKNYPDPLHSLQKQANTLLAPPAPACSHCHGHHTFLPTQICPPKSLLRCLLKLSLMTA